MAILGEAKRSAAALFAQGQHLAALRLYDAVVAQAPLDYEARIGVADVALALGDTRAPAIYRATAQYCLRAGHPLAALVCARVLASQTGEREAGSQIEESLAETYGMHSARIGRMAARIALPADDTAISVPDAGEPWPADGVHAALFRAEHCCDTLEGYPPLLHPIPLLSAMSEAGLRRVLAALLLRRLPIGHMVLAQGDPGTALYFVASGQLSVLTTDGVGQSTELARLGQNAVFGEMALLSAAPRSASVQCLSEANIFEIELVALRALADEIGPVAEALHGFTRERLLANMMATSPLFQPFSRMQQRELLRRFISQDIAENAVVIRQGEVGRGLFVVLSGEFSVLQNSADSAVPLGVLRQGDVFGEMSIVGDAPAAATVIATRPATVLFLGREYAMRMMAGVPEVKGYLEDLAQQRETENSLVLGEDESDGDRILI